MTRFIFLEIRPLPLPKLDLFRPSDTFSKGEGKRKTVFERVIVLRVEEVLIKKGGYYFFSITSFADNYNFNFCIKQIYGH